jgi:hypothetical protein
MTPRIGDVGIGRDGHPEGRGRLREGWLQYVYRRRCRCWSAEGCVCAPDGRRWLLAATRRQRRMPAAVAHCGRRRTAGQDVCGDVDPCSTVGQSVSVAAALFHRVSVGVFGRRGCPCPFSLAARQSFASGPRRETPARGPSGLPPRRSRLPPSVPVFSSITSAARLQKCPDSRPPVASRTLQKAPSGPRRPFASPARPPASAAPTSASPSGHHDEPSAQQRTRHPAPTHALVSSVAHDRDFSGPLSLQLFVRPSASSQSRPH